MKARIFQRGWNFSQDGPGNRLVYHLQGCNLRCPWCCNPEGLSRTGTLLSGRSRAARPNCRAYSLEELVREAGSARALFHSGGGVTLSGGEPTLQFDFVRDFFRRLRRMKINTALETNGTHRRLRRTASGRSSKALSGGPA
jgi:pyruvate formate lyase activating enzyme